MSERNQLANKKRIVVKIGSSSLTHPETGNLNLDKIEKLVRILTDMRNSGKDVVLVTSGAIAVGRNIIGLSERPTKISMKQACAAIGQANLMTLYQKLFSEYNQVCAQILMTKYTYDNEICRKNARNTFEELFGLGVIPVVNTNDTVSTDELEDLNISDNDTLSAMVSELINADLLILLSDIDGMFTDDPRENPDAKLISEISSFDDSLFTMAKDSKSSVGTGGMYTKIKAAKLVTENGADMIIANGKDVNILKDILAGEDVGTLFKK